MIVIIYNNPKPHFQLKISLLKISYAINYPTGTGRINYIMQRTKHYKLAI